MSRPKSPARKRSAARAAKDASAPGLARAEARYRELFDHIADAIFVVDPETHRVIDCNEEACRRYEYTREEFLGMDPVTVHPPEEREAVRQRLRQQDTSTAEFTHITKSGRRFPVEVRSRVIDHEGRRARISLIQDLSAHKRVEESLRESEDRFRAVGDNIAAAIYIHDGQRMLYVNPACEEISGYTREALMNQVDFWEMVHPDFRALVQERARARLEGRATPHHYEFKILARDGSERWLDFTASRVQFAGRTAILSIAVDMTGRRALEEQLRQALKMEAVGRLAGGVAHDFNNLLTVIKGHAELLLDSLDRRDPLRTEVEEMQKAAERAAALTRQLLAFSRQQVLAPQVLDLNTVVCNVDRLLRRLLGEDIELHALLADGLGRVRADPGQIEQVILNLAVNARDAMPRGGKLTVETGNVALDETYARERVEVKPGDYVLLAVSDTGTGMSPETCSHIFEPFFTTKDPAKGTGLGLSTVYGIVKQSDGHISVYSEPGMGTTLRIYLPRVEETQAAASAEPAAAATDTGDETILLVEDEDGVRGLVRQVLKRKGYSVLEARDGGEALLTCEHFHEPIHLLLTDVVLAHMSGRELAERLSVLRPEMKVLYMSGYTDDAIVQHGVLTQETAFLQKPFTTEALARKVREVLDAGVAARD
ncbi:MAG TPA: PAS domain S-box protein [Terriglobales bacterium]|nr:PAS domain S-box protein [Terriglobales bacterium]